MDITHPLVVDLDGTLINTDVFYESTLKILHKKPLHLLSMWYWLLQGKAATKKMLASHVSFDVSALPYNSELINWLKQKKAQGQKLILCTASDSSIGSLIAEHLGLFDEVLASDGKNNLSGQHKANLLVERFGKNGFDYVGNSTSDLHVWKCARNGILVNVSNKLEQKAKAVCNIELVFMPSRVNLVAWFKLFRCHQWLKNILLFIPLIAAHQYSEMNAWVTLTIAFISFNLCASSMYIVNDLFDLESDRKHPRKRFRPFASGSVPVWIGMLLAPMLLFISLSLARSVNADFFLWVEFYAVVTCAYSWILKRFILIDCFVLAMLYTLRIAAGASVVNVKLSFWLLAFSIFLFLSLAFVKRFSELNEHSKNKNEKVSGRGYRASDAFIIQSFGVTSGYVSVLVLALYINSEAVLHLYHTPEILWAIVPLMLLWISWTWMQAFRGNNMRDDPAIFIVRDKMSLVIGCLCVAAFVAAQIW